MTADPILYLDSTTDTCVEKCPERYYEDMVADSTKPTCESCDDNCWLCGETAIDCKRCADSAGVEVILYLDTETSTCV